MKSPTDGPRTGRCDPPRCPMTLNISDGTTGSCQGLELSSEYHWHGSVIEVSFSASENGYMSPLCSFMVSVALSGPVVIPSSRRSMMKSSPGSFSCAALSRSDRAVLASFTVNDAVSTRSPSSFSAHASAVWSLTWRAKAFTFSPSITMFSKCELTHPVTNHSSPNIS